MANELKITVNVAWENTNKDDVYKAINVDQTGTEYGKHIQEIGTSEEAVAASDMTAQGFVYAENLDGTNYVEIGTTGKLAVKLGAGEFSLWRTAGALYAKANTAAVRVKFVIFEA